MKVYVELQAYACVEFYTTHDIDSDDLKTTAIMLAIDDNDDIEWHIVKVVDTTDTED